MNLRLKPSRSLLAKALALLTTTLVILVGGLSGPAQAHGSATDPPSRNYGCWNRTATSFQDPEMANYDPMCWQAWQADPSAMWNWNGLYREGVAGNHEAAIPDGTLCSGGKTQSPRYDSMDTIGPWKTVDKPNQFTLTITDQAQHGADYLKIYITKQGFDALTEPLGWDDLELVTTTGKIAPAGSYSAAVNAGTRTGRHIVYTIWQASHLDQSYYFCSDVNFTGGSGSTPTATSTPTPTATVSPTTSPTVSPTANPTVSPTANPTATVSPTANPTATATPTSGTAGCSATLKNIGSWSGGFQSEVTVTAGSAAIKSWTVGWTLASGQTIGSLWSGTSTVSGGSVTVTNAAWNGALNAGGSTTFGFIGNGSASTPTLTCTSA